MDSKERLQSLQSKCAPLWRPKPKLTVCEHAENFLCISAESSSRPGAFKPLPFQPEMMNVFDDVHIRRVTVMGCSQFGKTTMLAFILAYFCHWKPSPILFVIDTEGRAERFSKDRLAKMVRDSPSMRSVFPSNRSKSSDNTILQKMGKGFVLDLAGANAAGALSGNPKRVVLFDETDRYGASAGKEGSPIKLGEKRTSSFPDHVIGHFSTPGDEETSHIEPQYKRSDMRVYMVHCPQCSGEHEFGWWPDGKGWGLTWPEGRPEEAFHVCPHEGCIQTDEDKPGMLAGGYWKAMRPEVKNHAGFFIWEAYSPFKKFGDIARDYLDAKGDPEEEKVFANTTLGRTWKTAQNEGDAEDYLARREHYDAALIPADAALLEMSVDVQGDRLELMVCAYGLKNECFIIEWRVLQGSPANPEVWEALDEARSKIYNHESGRQLRIVATAIDTGGHHTGEVYKYVMARKGQRVFAIKGANRHPHPIAEGPRKTKSGCEIWMVGTVTVKQWVFWAVKKPEEKKPSDTVPDQASGSDAFKAGRVRFPSTATLDFFNQLFSERSVTKTRNGSLVLGFEKKPGQSRNEVLDLLVYNIALHRGILPRYIDTETTINKFLNNQAVSSGRGTRNSGL